MMFSAEFIFLFSALEAVLLILLVILTLFSICSCENGGSCCTVSIKLMDGRGNDDEKVEEMWDRSKWRSSEYWWKQMTAYLTKTWLLEDVLDSSAPLPGLQTRWRDQRPKQLLCSWCATVKERLSAQINWWIWASATSSSEGTGLLSVSAAGEIFTSAVRCQLKTNFH